MHPQISSECSLVQRLRATNLIRGIETVAISSDEDCMLPVYFSDAEISDERAIAAGINDYQCHFGSGESFDKEQSRISATAEALEGYCSDNLTNSKEIVCSISDLSCRSVSPIDIGLYAEQQYEYLDFDKYDSKLPLGWMLGQSVTHSESVYVPALSTYLNYTPAENEQVLFQPGSTGLATGSTRSQAILNGLYEVIERDAFLITWLNKLPGQSIIVDSNSRISPFVKRLKKDGFTVKLYSLSTDSECSVVICILVKEMDDKCSAFVGLGADLNLYRACEKCVFEAMRAVITQSQESTSTVIQDRIAQLNQGLCTVTDMEDHGWYYLKRSSVAEFEFLDCLNNQPILVEETDEIGLSNGQIIEHLVAELEKIDTEVIYIDLTTPNIKGVGAYVVRVIVPGFQPMFHGEQLRRLGVDRLFNYPHRQGFSLAQTNLNQLNNDPHPLG